MKAVIGKQVSNGKNYSGKKEMVSAWSGVVSTSKGPVEVVTIRSWMGRSSSASVVYSAIWVHGNGIYTAGHGTAGGYGYHKESAAIQEAIDNANIELFGDVYGREKTNKRACIGGVGDNAIRKAIEAIIRACGYRGKVEIITH